MSQPTNDTPGNVFEVDPTFGFSLVDEATIKANEEALAKENDATKILVAEKQAEVEAVAGRLKEVMATISPLLKALRANPDKQYILWPDRATKIDEFAKKLAKAAYPNK